MRQLRGPALALPAVVLALACGGKGGAAKPPAPSGDPCAAGIHAAGITGRAATWDAVAAMVGSTADAMCQFGPCGPDEAVSFVGASPDELIAVKVDGGWTGIGDLWNSDEPQPTAKLTRLGDLGWLSLAFEQLGRDDVTLDDGTETTAPVVGCAPYVDYVIDPASGKALWRGACGARLRWVGWEWAELSARVGARGVEGALLELRDAGVYLTIGEFKRQTPVCRVGLTLEPSESDFDSPSMHGAAVSGQSGPPRVDCR